jgi:hypothetical protein
MTVPSSTPTGDAAGGSVEQRLKQLQQDLAAQRRRIQSSTMFTAIIGAVVLIAICGYFGYGYSQMAEFTEPQKLLTLASGYIDEQVPLAREKVEHEVKDRAPEWAHDLSKQAKDQLPTARVKLEQYALEQADEHLESTAQQADEQFKKYLTENKAKLNKIFAELAKSDELPESTLLELEENMNDYLQNDLKQQAGQFIASLTEINAHLKKLRNGQKLDTEEQYQRNAVMILRRLQVETGGEPPPPEGRAGPANPVAKEKDPKGKTKDRGKINPPIAPPPPPSPVKEKAAPKDKAAPTAKDKAPTEISRDKAGVKGKPSLAPPAPPPVPAKDKAAPKEKAASEK